MNVLALIANGEHLRLVTRAFALFADEFDVGEELHLDGNGAVALAGFAASAGDVEGEVSSREAAFLRFGQRGKQVADSVKGLNVRNWIRARGASDRRLVNEDNFIEILNAV